MIERYEIVKAMHSIVLCMNNEDAYSEWIVTVPDEPSDNDFEVIAKDDELFSETCTAFKSIACRYLKDGLYIGGRLF